MQIITRRFLLRDFIDEDIEAFEAYHDDPRSKVFYGDEHTGEGHARELVRLFQDWALEIPRSNYQLAIVRKERQEDLISCCGLRTKDALPNTAELGIEMSPAYWGCFGYALEIIYALFELGFDDLHINMIYGSTVSANTRITRLLNAFGATAVDRTGPAWMSAKGWTEIEWQITQDQWQSIRHARRIVR